MVSSRGTRSGGCQPPVFAARTIHGCNPFGQDYPAYVAAWQSGIVSVVLGSSSEGQPMKRPRARVWCGLAIAAMAAGRPQRPRAQPADEFFRGKRELIFITSSNVGGGYDSYSRLLARYMSKYLPGNPRYVVQNMLGGGGMRATNFLYNVAPKDGSVIALGRSRHADGASALRR